MTMVLYVLLNFNLIAIRSYIVYNLTYSYFSLSSCLCIFLFVNCVMTNYLHTLCVIVTDSISVKI